MRITIEVEDQICSTSNPKGITIEDALELFGRAMRGVGFYFDGEINIMES